jgi:hypothetical protein
MGALPRGRPGWPEFALWTASAASTRIAFTQVVSRLAKVNLLLKLKILKR